MRARTERREELEEVGVLVVNEETDEELGVLGHSVGPHGVSTGVWSRCETTWPLTEVGVTHLNGRPVEPHE